MRLLDPTRSAPPARSVAQRIARLAALAALAGTACRGAPPQAATATGPPSIVLVSLDTTRADRLGCYGHPSAATPTIDRLAREGVLFQSARTPVPITLPAHATLFTGLWPHRHGIRDNGIYHLPPDVPTLAEQLAGAGYATAAAVGAAVLDRAYGLDRGFGSYDDVAGERGLAITERGAREVTDAALRQVAALDEPFFLFVHYFDAHATYRPPEPFASRFRNTLYEGEIAYADQQLGRLLAEMDAAGRLDHTLIVVTADHGEGLGEHGEATHGVFLYDSTLRVPLVVKGPGWPRGERVNRVVSLADVMPTLLEAAGATVPEGLDGRSLATPDGATPSEPPIPLESEFGRNSYGWAALSGLNDGRWKWIRAPRPELYDLESDPEERDNLVDRRPETVEELQAAWTAVVRGDRRATLLEDTDSESAERLARLRALGYVAATRLDGEDASGRPDPKDVIGSLGDINAARQHLARGEMPAAEAVLEGVLEKSPDNVSALVLLGSARLIAGRPAEALAPLARAAERAPLNADVHFNLGLAQLGVGRAEAAEAAWRRTLELMPRYAEAAVNLIDMLDRTGRKAEASQLLEEALARGLSSPLLDVLEGRLAAERGDAETARVALGRALRAELPPPVAAEARALLESLEP